MLHQYLQFFRVLLAVWRFFDRVSQAATFFVRSGFSDADWGPWVECLRPARERKIGQLFLNARQNYLFAARSLLDQFADELRAGHVDSTSEHLVKNLAAFEVRGIDPAARRFQFRYCRNSEDVYVSIPLEMAEFRSRGDP